jgi:hypothetical protein
MSKITLSAALAVAAVVMMQAGPLSAKTYQVTGPVLEVSDKVIVVDKAGEKHEITRNAETKVEGDVKKGSKVTVQYEMIAVKIEAKEAAAPAPAAKPAAKATK